MVFLWFSYGFLKLSPFSNIRGVECCQLPDLVGGRENSEDHVISEALTPNLKAGWWFGTFMNKCPI